MYNIVSKSPYLRWVGDSEFNAAQDDPQFEVCNGDENIRQYFNFSKGLQYRGEKPELVQHFMEAYKAPESNQSGWIRIRFVVNCKGETGRFRVMGANKNYEPMDFDQAITGQLLDLTRALANWGLQPDETNPGDYYQYLIFKIEAGRLIEILP